MENKKIGLRSKLQTNPSQKNKTIIVILISAILLICIMASSFNTHRIENGNIVKYVHNGTLPAYVYLKKHYCPECDAQLTTDYESNIINYKSDEDKNTVIDVFFLHGVEVRKVHFKCPECNLIIELSDMKEYEKNTNK